MPPERRTTKGKAVAGAAARKPGKKPVRATAKGDGESATGSDARPVARGVWSGSITFGLVTVPVELYAVTRPAAAGLRMLAADGMPLARIYVSADGAPFERPPA